MKLNETQKVDTNLYELNITVDGEQYAKALDASFKKNAAKLNIPGFRKGKAPKSIVYKPMRRPSRSPAWRRSLIQKWS